MFYRSYLPLVTTAFLAAGAFSHASGVEDLAVLAGQHVIYTYPGISPPDVLFDLVDEGKVGGLILFRENINQTNLTETSALMSKFQQAHAKSPAYKGFPLPIMIDQEGGYVKRITNGGPWESAKEMGLAGDPSLTSSQGGSDAADALIAAGVNINLAPVLDVYREESSFMNYWQRSFGNSSSLVTRCVVPFLTAMRKKGIAAAGKHFPGNGANPAGSDTDAGIVTLNLTLDEIRAIDEIPYRSAIQAGLGLIMASWDKYINVDNRPAGLSEKWLQGELRGRLGYNGVIMTDALEAGAVKPYGDWSTVALLAKQAGADMILCASRNVTQGLVATEGLVAGLKNGGLSRKGMEESFGRIMAFRSSLRG
ncbi:putative secreted glycosyl hydrolase [Talaromyces pinophilus]|nr:putative secreted glycosyl hydrolase [Talaromyces pinophilus]